VSGFQMAQFGHQYSSMFLGMLQTKMAFTQPPEIFGFTLDTILTGYAHGRQTPPLLGVEWDAGVGPPIPETATGLGRDGVRTRPYPGVDPRGDGRARSPASWTIT